MDRLVPFYCLYLARVYRLKGDVTRARKWITEARNYRIVMTGCAK